MARYEIWDGTSDIYTPSGTKYTPEEWMEKYPWVTIPGAKMIITAGKINGGAAMEFDATRDAYKKMGAAITNGMTDQEVLAAIEDFEDNPPGANEPDNEERIAAAMEAQVLMMTPTQMSQSEGTGSSRTVGESPAYSRIKRNYKRGLWSAALVNAALSAGQINTSEASEILGEV